jgi:hypothetical protein
MLLQLTGDIAECYQYAAHAHERAKRANDPATKQDFLNLERRWLSLAHNYEFAEQLREIERHFPEN